MFEANKIKQPFLQISKCPSLSQKEGGYRRIGYETNPRIQIKDKSKDTNKNKSEDTIH